MNLMKAPDACARVRASLLVVALALAGCVAPDAPTEPVRPSALDDVLAAVRGLPCEADVDDGTSANLQELGASPLDRAGYAAAGELDLRAPYALVARYGTGGFSLVDVADPRAPTELAAWDPEVTDLGLDVKWLTDGSAGVVAGQDGVRVVDVRDPAQLRLETEVPFARPQAHMLLVWTVDGREYVSATRANGEDLVIWSVGGGPGAHTLDPVASPRLTPLSQATPLFSPVDVTRPHDMFFAHDELLDAPVLWIANVEYGIAALDVSDPARPVQILDMPNPGSTYTHTVRTVVVEGRRITMTVSEVGYNKLNVWDTTDLDAPKKLAEWSVPRATDPQHNLQIVLPYVYVAHYRYGVFVFGFDDLVAGRTTPIAHLASTGADLQSSSATAAAGPLQGFGGTWDVGLAEGIVYVTDGALRSVAFGCVTPGDPRATSVG